MEREREGLPGLSVRWGAWEGGGMASEITLQRSADNGLLSVSPSFGMRTLVSLIRRPPCPIVTVCPMNPQKLPSRPYFRKIRIPRPFEESDAEERGPWVNELMEAEPEDRCRIIRRLVEVEGARVAGVVELDENVPWGMAGFDSLSLTELQDSLRRKLGNSVPLSSTALFDYPCPNDLANYIETSLFPEARRMEVVYRATRVEPMAIVGMACRLPGGSERPNELWEFLEQKGDGMSEIPLTRMDWRKYYDADGGGGKSYTNRGAFISGAMMFDHSRFGISMVEASEMDPQQRIALEVAYEALDQALSRPPDPRDRLSIGCFVTSGTSDFVSMRFSSDTITPYSGTGVSSSIASNRISHVFGLRGPSMTIDTACSSSLVALDAACKAIANHDCEMAVVVGVSINTSMIAFASCCAANMLSRKGRCATFSDEAD
eukprot:2242280-Rhodomonas_salina.1